MESLGICLGASTIGMVRLRRTAAGDEILWARTQSHDGDARRTLIAMLDAVEDRSRLRVAATGRKFRHYVALSTISEPEAVEYAVRHVLPLKHPYRVVLSVGGETFMAYHLDDEGRIQGVHTGNKCASGTGEFFLQQLGRMATTVHEVAGMGVPDEEHKVSGRCSVFCKSDCTHALNKGVAKPQVVAGLTKMMAGKALELVQKIAEPAVILMGGCAKNHAMVHYLREGIADLFIPASAPYFEALGTGLWALDSAPLPFPDLDHIFMHRDSQFSYLAPLHAFRDKVHFKQHPRGQAMPGDTTILGLDVGSTTTKGVIMRRRDKAILAADYLRTNGDPIGASRQVYTSLARQITVPIEIVGLGVTGSGRQIAGLHAMTEGVINEIIAHATAAVHFDPEVDTIFEIGGQDAKYTYITNGVPSDYAMNEACSAGTGSFLEESAKESLGIEVSTIGKTAYEATRPPNFNDQCAAFIGSDIKGAVQEGVPLADIVAGLVYSICMNYTNRVKGNRPVGNKVFMQGGVCYNEAIPAAMAALTGKEIVVPPDPGLMGAFGVALEVDRRMVHDLLAPGCFDLAELAGREVHYGKPFRCGGGKDKCDRGCEIARIEIDEKTYPFGGICNRYDNIVHKRKVDVADADLVLFRQRRVFRDLAPDDPTDRRPTVGMNRSFLINTYFPLYNRFFAEIGYRLVIPEICDPHGMEQKGSAFCYPVELAHGYWAHLLGQNPDFLFLPHLWGLPTGGNRSSCTCVFVQGEPFYLASAFPSMAADRILSPYLNFSQGLAANTAAFEEIGKRLGLGRKKARAALTAAIAEQERFFEDIRDMGQNTLAWLAKDPSRMAVVLFGRPYNSFALEANKGIPAKFASRGMRIIPFDMLPYEREPLEEGLNMYWATGQFLMKASGLVARNAQLYATYITNFSCGPDSFLIGYFRDTMGRKPSLTLELDNHTADAGIETRIEAFLDIVSFYRQIDRQATARLSPPGFKAAAISYRGAKAGVETTDGRWRPLQDKRVKVVIPAMGRFGTPLLARAFARVGVRAEALPPANEDILKLGRGNSSCKECLPLQTTVGSLLHYLKNVRPKEEITAYFMPSAEGPCRFGQYHVYSRRVIAKHQIPDAAVLTLNSLNSYGGLSDRFTLAAWRAIIIGDIFDEMWATVLAAARDKAQGLAVLDQAFRDVMGVIDVDWRELGQQLRQSANRLADIHLIRPFSELPKISLIGEIYVRHDPIALQQLIERLAERGFVVRTAPNSEWIKYVDWLIKTGVEGSRSLGFWLRHHVKRHFDHRIRKALAPSGLFHVDHGEIDDVIKAGKQYISPRLTGEAILTVGSALHEILSPSCGVISIGPFGCMPTRMAEAILNEKFNTKEKGLLLANNGHSQNGKLRRILDQPRKFPFLAIETDGNAFPQVIEARLEAFSLQARRLNDMLNEAR